MFAASHSLVEFELSNDDAAILLSARLERPVPVSELVSARRADDCAAPVVDVIGTPDIGQWWQSPATYALIAFILVVLAALVDAIAARHLVAGIITVVTPFVALALFVLATPGAVPGVELRTLASMALVLAAVALRETWMRAGAPQLDPSHNP